MKSLSKLIKESKKEKDEKVYPYDCLMLDVNIPYLMDTLNTIDDKDVYNDSTNNYGKEKHQHITVIYGLKPNEVNIHELIDYVCKKETIKFNIVNLSLFENEDFDVLKADIQSDDLNELYNYIKDNFPNVQTYPTYNPHITLAYINKGFGKNYISNEITDVNLYESKEFVYSLSYNTYSIKLKFECGTK